MNRIAIVGAHGKVARYLIEILRARGDEAVGVVRNPEHADDISRLGGLPATVDIESAGVEELAAAFAGADGVVFSAGAGPGSGVARKRTVDFGGSVLSAEAAQRAGIRRFVQVSAVGVDDPVAVDADEQWAAYVAAKRDADASLRGSDLDWTILRPVGLTDDPGTGLIALDESVPRGTVPRQDVAATIAAVLDEAGSIGKTWELASGSVPIVDAVRRSRTA
jgi:uncharacterized protein YbjT (DUF2867 family)